MNAVLLDTHILIWFLQGETRLSPPVISAIDRATQQNAAFIAAITVWEIAMLVAKGRVTLIKVVQEWVEDALNLPGIQLAPFTPAVAIASTRLPGTLHGDPADRILAATARHLDATLANHHG